MSFEENQNFDANPILQPENYHKQYQDNINALRGDPRVVEFDKLCFEVFEKFEPGRRLLEMCIERYVIPALAMRGTATYQLDVLWGEGFKELIRLFRMSVKSHQERILAGKN